MLTICASMQPMEFWILTKSAFPDSRSITKMSQWRSNVDIDKSAFSVSISPVKVWCKSSTSIQCVQAQPKLASSRSNKVHNRSWQQTSPSPSLGISLGDLFSCRKLIFTAGLSCRLPINFVGYRSWDSQAKTKGAKAAIKKCIRLTCFYFKAWEVSLQSTYFLPHTWWSKTKKQRQGR